MDAPDLMTGILQRIATAKPRMVWTPADFLDLGSRDAVDKVLQRLAKAGDLFFDRPAFDLASACRRPSRSCPKAV